MGGVSKNSQTCFETTAVHMPLTKVSIFYVRCFFLPAAPHHWESIKLGIQSPEQEPFSCKGPGFHNHAWKEKDPLPVWPPSSVGDSSHLIPFQSLKQTLISIRKKKKNLRTLLFWHLTLSYDNLAPTVPPCPSGCLGNVAICVLSTCSVTGTITGTSCLLFHLVITPTLQRR